ncbi:hypothetical protein SAMN05421798_1464 [Pseudovibrio axinellae]|nr:hypothetical protein SAMN05421798_1464 [Pseudovibrio axinellae]
MITLISYNHKRCFVKNIHLRTNKSKA